MTTLNNHRLHMDRRIILRPIPARSLLDSGPQPNLITVRLSLLLRLKKEGARLNLTGASETISFSKSSINLTVTSRVNSTQFNARFWVLSSISNLHIPNNIKLAAPCFHKPRKIDLLIGSEIFFELMCVGHITSGPSQIVIGKYDQSKGSINNSVRHLSTVIENESNIYSIVKKFWELEELPNESRKIYSVVQYQCDDKFRNSIRRLASEWFVVSLPFKSDTKLLCSSFEVAKRRFLSLERRLFKDDEVRHMYHNFMKEYFNLGHVSLFDNMPDFLLAILFPINVFWASNYYY